jgi:hypothetical protein
MFAGHVMFGGCVSFTVTVKLQLGPAVVHNTVVVPFGKNDPEAGVHATVPHPPPVVVGANVTTAPHWFASLFFVMLAGQVIVHGFCTVILNVQVPWRFDVSVTVHVTVVIPTGKQNPDAGLHTTGFGPSGQLSLPAGVAYVTTPHGSLNPGVVNVMLAGHVTVGFCVSLTVTVNVQLAVLLEASLTVQETVVTPFWKVVPDAGVQTGVPTPGQLSVAVAFA